MERKAMTFWTVLFLIVCNMIAMKGSKVIITLFSIQLGAPQFIIGVLVGLYSLFPMILAITAGKLADRMGARPPMIAGSLVLCAGLTLPYLFPYTVTLYVQAALVGAGHVFFNVAVQNTIGGMSDSKEARTRNFSNFGLAMATGSFIGPLIAGFAIDHIGHRYAYLILALTPLVSAAVLARGRIVVKNQSAQGGEGKKKEGGKTGEAHAGGSFSLLKGNRPLRRALLTGAVILTGIDLFQFYMPIYGHHIGLSASQIGIVLGTFSAAAFVVRIWMPAIVSRYGPERVLVGSLFIAAITYTTVPFIEHMLPLCIICFMLGLGTGCGQPLTLQLIYERAPNGRSGEAIGLRSTLNNFTHIVTPLAFGALGTAFGVTGVFLANSLMLASGGFVIRRK